MKTNNSILPKLEKSYLIRARYPTDCECHRYIDWFQVSATSEQESIKKAKKNGNRKDQI